MKKVYYLKTCDTCRRILKELSLPSEFTLQDIKTEEITSAQLKNMQSRSGSYEALFSKRAQLYKTMNLKDRDLTEQDFKQYILKHYTFLKRPVIIYHNSIFIGNSKKTIAAIKAKIQQNN